MENKYFFHHIKRTNGAISKEIDVEDTLDKAKLDFHKFLGDYGYGLHAGTDFVSALITDAYGNIVRPYDETWIDDGVQTNKYFMHRIRHDKSQTGAAAWTKGIEVKETYDAAKQALNAYLGAYGYEQTQDTQNYDFVDCLITDIFGSKLMADTWKEPEAAPEPETF